MLPWRESPGLLVLDGGQMKFSAPLKRAQLIKRYKRFLADIETKTGDIETIHCPNTGSMRNCAEPGYGVWYSESDNPKRKYRFTWELAEDFNGNWIGINTNNANKLVKEGFEKGKIKELAGYDDVQAEVRYGEENSRIDFLLRSAGKADCYVEVKSVTLLVNGGENGSGLFPDAVSARGQKHLRELARLAEDGKRAVLLYCVQHTGVKSVSPAREIDPKYAEAIKDAQSAGVEIYAYSCRISPEEIVLNQPIPFVAA